MKNFFWLAVIGVCMAGCCPESAVAQSPTPQPEKFMKDFPGWTETRLTEEFLTCISGLKHEARCGCLVGNVAKAMPPEVLEGAKVFKREELKMFMNDILNQCVAGMGGSKQ